MATEFLIQYSVSATPIEEIEAVFVSNKVRLVHSLINSSVSGGRELECDNSPSNVRYMEYTTTAVWETLDTIFGATMTGVDFIMIKIVDSNQPPATPDVTLKIGTESISRLSGNNDVILIRPHGKNGNSYTIASNIYSNIIIMVGISP
jgi:hypothetical protein